MQLAALVQTCSCNRIATARARPSTSGHAHVALAHPGCCTRKAASSFPSWTQRSCRSPRSSHRVHAGSGDASLDIDALLFDCDGVLCDTEAEGHRVAFNEVFKDSGLDVTWDYNLYGQLLSVGGGKERMTKHFTDLGDQGPFAGKAEKEQKDLIMSLHHAKTDKFMDLISNGTLKLRPGVKNLIEQAQAAGVQVAVCSTSNERSVGQVVDVLIGGDAAPKIKIYAGDVVPKKKPDPAIYLLAAKELGVKPERCVVVEDSDIGLRSAKAAGMRCLVTVSAYTGNEDFSQADRVVKDLCLGGDSSKQIKLADLTLKALQQA